MWKEVENIYSWCGRGLIICYRSTGHRGCHQCCLVQRVHVGGLPKAPATSRAGSSRTFSLTCCWSVHTWHKTCFSCIYPEHVWLLGIHALFFCHFSGWFFGSSSMYSDGSRMVVTTQLLFRFESIPQECRKIGSFSLTIVT